MNWKNIETGYKNRAEYLRTKKPHEVLGIQKGASSDEVKAAYRRLVKVYHPDGADTFMQATNEEVLKVINAAYSAMLKALK